MVSPLGGVEAPELLEVVGAGSLLLIVKVELDPLLLGVDC